MQIAPDLKSRLEFVQDTLSSVNVVLDDAYAADLETLQNKVDGWAAKVAFIGQVKAGKSTLLNAFLGLHDFLPSDINPWTSVVTNLRFNLPCDPENGVSFEFFSEDDWTEIIEGKSAMADFSEELLPGFDADLLREQSKELREKAKRRLGDHYHTILGSTHEFNFTSPDLLKRYVCASAEAVEDTAQENLGRYAALTREANVFMQNDLFQVPTILTDTPGVNDPFLVRDEVTCRALDRSDLFVMVLSAHQPLTDVDLGLIRLLSNENARDVLIFVNRMDELDEYGSRYEALLEDVSDRLREAIPETEFKVMLGSGFMADAVLCDGLEGQALRDELDTDTLASYLQSAYGYCPEDQNERLLLGSGMQNVKEALSEMITTGVPRRQIDQLLDDTRAEISAVKFALENEVASVSSDIVSLQEDGVRSLTLAVGNELIALKKARDDIDGFLSRAQSQFSDLLEGSQVDLEEILNAKIDAFLDDQELTIESSLTLEEDQQVPDETITIYLGALHAKIEQAVAAQFAESRADIDMILQGLADVASASVTSAFGKQFQDVSLANLPFETFSTTLTMAKRSIEANLAGKRSLAFWKDKSIDLTKTIQTLKVLATAELTPAVKTLLNAFQEAQQARVTEGLERVAMTKRVVEQGFAERGQRMKDHYALTQQDDGAAIATVEVTQQLQSKVDDLQTQTEELSNIENSLVKEPSSKAA